MLDEEFKLIDELSDYRFIVGISNSTIEVQLDEETSTKSDDFLRMLEYGSPLNAIVATRPIERTWLEIKDYMMVEYDKCITDILNNKVDKNDIRERIVALGNFIEGRLKMAVDSRIKNDVSCKIYCKGIKIK